jgi:superfamily II DNA or RNA helicase
VDESETPPIIFAQHVPIVLAIAERLGVEPIYGDTSSAKRHEIITEFQAGGLPALVCHPAVMAHGVDLTCSNHIIFAQPPLSVEQWLQAVARIERLGQSLKMMISLIEGSSVERDTWDRLENKITDVDNLEAVIKLVSEDV